MGGILGLKFQVPSSICGLQVAGCKLRVPIEFLRLTLTLNLKPGTRNPKPKLELGTWNLEMYVPRVNFLVTGGAGFIGSNLCEQLLNAGHAVWAFDDLNDAYDPSQKQRNLQS